MAQSNQNNLRYTKLFVGNLFWKTTSQDLINFFQQYGEVLYANVVFDSKTGSSKCYGFVTFRDPRSANNACSRKFHEIDGRVTNCNMACFGAKNNQINNGQIAPSPPMPRFIYPQAPLPYSCVPYGQYNYPTYGRSCLIIPLQSSMNNNHCNNYYNYGPCPFYGPQQQNQYPRPIRPTPVPVRVTSPPVNNGVNNVHMVNPSPVNNEVNGGDDRDNLECVATPPPLDDQNQDDDDDMMELFLG